MSKVEFRKATPAPVLVEGVHLDGRLVGTIWQGPKGEFQYRPLHRSALGPYSGLPYHSLTMLHEDLIKKARKETT